MANNHVWHTKLVECSRYPGSRGLVLRLTTASTSHADELDAVAIPPHGAEQDELREKTLAILADIPEWQLLEQVRLQHGEAKRVADLAEAKLREAEAALDALRLAPETKSWASRLQAAEQTTSERKAEQTAAVASFRAVERALLQANRAAHGVARDAAHTAWHAIAVDRQARLAAALEAVAAAMAPLLAELVVAEGHIRPAMDHMALMNELLPTLFVMDQADDEDIDEAA